MSVSVTWYGHSNFKVSCGDVTVFIDPFFTHNPSCPVTWNEAGKPDLVLVTHDHGDHTGDAVAICKSSGATCGCIVGTAERLIDAGMPQASIPAGIGFNIGGTIEVKGVRVTMTQAFHTSESGAPAGYVVTMPDGFTFYHAGDTGLFSSMELIGSLYPLDLALLPVGGFFTMDGLQAAHARADQARGRASDVPPVVFSAGRFLPQRAGAAPQGAGCGDAAVPQPPRRFAGGHP